MSAGGDGGAAGGKGAGAAHDLRPTGYTGMLLCCLACCQAGSGQGLCLGHTLGCQPHVQPNLPQLSNWRHLMLLMYLLHDRLR